MVPFRSFSTAPAGTTGSMLNTSILRHSVVNPVSTRDVTVYLFGNCQMRALAGMIGEDHPDWTISATDVSDYKAATVEDGDRHLDQIRAADVVIAQPVEAWNGVEALSLAGIRAVIGPDTPLITLPSIVFEGHHAAFTYLANRFDGYGMPYHNVHTIDMFCRGYRREDMAVLQGSPDFYTRDFVDQGVAASLAGLRLRERAHDTTISVAELIEEGCTSTVLMHTVNHPTRVLFARVLNRIYRAIGERPIAREQGSEPLPYPRIPPLPTVLRHLGLPDESPLFITTQGELTREDYLAGSVDYYARLLLPDLRAALDNSRGRAVLDAFHRDTKPALEEGIHQEVVRGVFQVLLKREPGDAELKAHSHSIASSGVRNWMAAIAAAEEFNAHFTPVSHPEPFLSDLPSSFEEGEPGGGIAETAHEEAVEPDA